MMKIRQRKGDCSIFLLMVVLATSCSRINNKNEQEYYDPKPYDSLWVSGLKLFSGYCGGCHIGVNKEEEFKGFIKSSKTIEVASTRISKTLKNKDHQDVNKKFNQQETDALAKYLLTPRKSGVVH